MTKIALLYRADRPSAVALLRAHDGELIDTLATFAAKPMAALRIALALRELKIETVSAGEPWLGPSLPALRHGLLWIEEQEKVVRIAAVARGVEHARLEGRPPGRLRRNIPPQAEKLIAGGRSIGAVARTIGVPESSLRSWAAQMRAERHLAELTRSTQEAT